MNWDAVGAVAELLGAIGVIATLVYLSIQIRNSTNVDRANIRANLTEGTQKALELAIANSELLIKTGSAEPLLPEERLRLTMCNRFLFRSYENYAYQYSLGLFEESEWEGVIKAIEGTLREPYAQEDWRAYRMQFSKAVQAIVDPLVPDVTDTSRIPDFIYASNLDKNKRAT